VTPLNSPGEIFPASFDRDSPNKPETWQRFRAKAFSRLGNDGMHCGTLRYKGSAAEKRQNAQDDEVWPAKNSLRLVKGPEEPFALKLCHATQPNSLPLRHATPPT
jgi:hypothetical protein